MVQFVSASPGLPVMNGIFKVCHWPEPPFLRILPARLFVTTCQKPSAFCLSFLDLLRCFSVVSFRYIQYFFFCLFFLFRFFCRQGTLTFVFFRSSYHLGFHLPYPGKILFVPFWGTMSIFFPFWLLVCLFQRGRDLIWELCLLLETGFEK